jgi:hypothetical protein
MPRGTVILHVSRPPSFLDRHEGRTICSIAQSIARLKGFHYAGPHEHVRLDAGSLFFVPDDTLLRRDADAVGVRAPKDLYGGIVPYPFVRTKAISHDLIDPTAARPQGWTHAFAERIADVVLPGFTAFTREDARHATRRLLEHGAVRAKQPRAAGGNGQHTLGSMREAEVLLGQLDEQELTTHGLVLELHLDDVRTLSLGRVTLDDTTVAYHGRQRMTRDNAGRCVYGGSDLTCVRGGWRALEASPLASAAKTAVRQARVYDEAMSEYGVVASRRNYDVGQGVDSAGRARSGVFEASWRVGGATPAEIAALETFARDPSIGVVHASSVEAYGGDVAPPAGAIVHFQGIDPDAGPVVRYSLVRGTSRRAR